MNLHNRLDQSPDRVLGEKYRLWMCWVWKLLGKKQKTKRKIHSLSSWPQSTLNLSLSVEHCGRLSERWSSTMNKSQVLACIRTTKGCYHRHSWVPYLDGELERSKNLQAGIRTISSEPLVDCRVWQFPPPHPMQGHMVSILNLEGHRYPVADSLYVYLKPL